MSETGAGKRSRVAAGQAGAHNKVAITLQELDNMGQLNKSKIGERTMELASAGLSERIEGMHASDSKKVSKNLGTFTSALSTYSIRRTTTKTGSLLLKVLRPIDDACWETRRDQATGQTVITDIKFSELKPVKTDEFLTATGQQGKVRAAVASPSGDVQPLPQQQPPPLQPVGMDGSDGGAPSLFFPPQQPINDVGWVGGGGGAGGDGGYLQPQQQAFGAAGGIRIPIANAALASGNVYTPSAMAGPPFPLDEVRYVDQALLWHKVAAPYEMQLAATKHHAGDPGAAMWHRALAGYHSEMAEMEEATYNAVLMAVWHRHLAQYHTELGQLFAAGGGSVGDSSEGNGASDGSSNGIPPSVVSPSGVSEFAAGDFGNSTNDEDCGNSNAEYVSDTHASV